MYETNYRPERLPPEAERSLDQKNIRAALDVVNRVHRASKAAQGPEPVTRAERSTLNDQIRVGEEKLLRRWATECKLFLPEQPFTDAGEAFGQMGGAEHQIYPNGGVYYKRNNLSYHGNWLEYLHRLVLHNYLFPEAPFTFLGLMDVDSELQAVVSQKALRAARGATTSEVGVVMKLMGFLLIRNNDYFNPSLTVLVEDLHDENVLVDADGDLLIFDPVVYIAKPEMKLPTH